MTTKNSKEIQPQINDAAYHEILKQAVAEIRTARTSIALQVNTTTNSVYWNLGKLLSEKQLEEGYGSGVVKQLSTDLKIEFPDMGVSPRNLWDMKRFYERYHQSDTKLRQLVAVLPWGHNLLLINKVKNNPQAEFYASETIAKAWTRDLLLNAIKMDTFGQAQQQIKTNNFENTLPGVHAEYANEVFKSTYNLGFLGVTQPVREL
ncbi:MAG: hypothetical protein RIS47_214, partial [Bacteroidota bacterium]